MFENCIFQKVKNIIRNVIVVLFPTMDIRNFKKCNFKLIFEKKLECKKIELQNYYIKRVYHQSYTSLALVSDTTRHNVFPPKLSFYIIFDGNVYPIFGTFWDQWLFWAMKLAILVVKSVYEYKFKPTWHIQLSIFGFN